MPEVLADLAVKLSADLQGFKKGLADGNSSADDFESHSSHVFGKIAGVVAGLGVTAAATKFFTGAIAEAREAAKVSADTALTIADTGAAAWTSAGHIGDLATSLSNYAGIDDEAIQSNENILLTFKSIQNAGTGANAVFDRAAKATVDLSSKFGDMKSSSIQVGKALEDPVKGLAALGKAGVTFDETQKSMIKHMVESGDKIGAQKMILSAIEGQVGGLAGAMADPWDRLQVTWKNVQEAVGTALLPVLNKVLTWGADLLPKALGVATQIWEGLKAAIDDFIGGWENADAKVGTGGFVGVMIKAGQDAQKIWQKVKEGIDGFVGGWQNANAKIGPGVSGFTATMLRMGAAAHKVFDDIKAFAGQVVAFFHAHPDLGLAMVSPAAEAIKQVIQHWQQIKPVIAETVKWISTNVIPAVRQVVAYMVEQFGHLVAWVKTEWPKISEAIGHVMVVIRDIIGVVVLAIAFIWEHAHTQIMAVAKATWDTIQATVSAAIEIVKDVINLVLDVINGDWGKAWHDITDIFSTVWGLIITVAGNFMVILWNLFVGALQVLAAIVGNGLMAVLGWFASLPGSILGALGDLGGLLIWAGLSLISGLKNGAVAAAEGLWGWLRSIGGAVIGVFWDAGSWLWNIGSQIIDGLVSGIRSAFHKVTDVLGSLSGLIPSWKGPPAKDAVMLHGNGRLIMQGLVDGLRSGYGDVQNFLAGVTGGIGGSIGVAPVAVAHSSRQSITVHHVLHHEGDIKLTGTAGDVQGMAKQLARPIRDELIKVSGTTGSLWGGR